MKSVATRSMIRSLLSDAGSCLEALESRSMLSVSVANPISDSQVTMNATATNIDLAGRFADPNLNGTIVRFQSVLGSFNVRLFDSDKPITVENFLRYVDGNLYDNCMIHRSVPGFVVQGGGFRATVPSPPSISSFPPILNEPGIPNTRGTLAMAKLGGNPNSATNQWFFNLADNRANLDTQNGGFTVFGQVLGDGMTVVDAIAAVPVFDADNGGVFGQVPLRNYTSGTVTNDNLVAFSDIGRTAAFSYSVTVGDPTLLSAQIVEGKLVLSYLQNKIGSTTVTVRATGADSPTNFIEDTFTVTVNPPPPELYSLNTSSTRVGISGNVVFTATGVVGNRVRYWFDTNNDGAVGDGDVELGTSTTSTDSYRVQIPATTIGLNPAAKILARAENSIGALSPVDSVIISIVILPPTSSGLRATPTPIVRAGTFQLSLLNLTDPDGSVQSVSFYRDTNNDGLYSEGTDTLITTVMSAPFVTSISTASMPAGSYKFLARATDERGDQSSWFSTTVTVTEAIPTLTAIKSTAPIVSSVSANRGVVNLIPGAVPTDRDGTVVRMEYYRDSDNDSILDPEDELIGAVLTPTPVGRAATAADWQLNISELIASLESGTYRFFARAFDVFGNRSTANAFTTVRINARPTIGTFTVTPKSPSTDPFAYRPDSITFSVGGIIDDVVTNGIRNVEIRADRDGNPEDYEVLIGNARRSGNLWTLTVATRNFPLGENRFQAVAIDNFGTLPVNGERSNPVNSTFEVRNSIPTLAGIAAKPILVANRGDTVTFTARTPKDRDGVVQKMQYFLDSDSNGIFDSEVDTLLGESLASTTSFSLPVTIDGRFRYRASATTPLGNLIFGRAFDGIDYSTPSSFNLLVNSPPTYDGTTTVVGSPVATVRSPLTIEASGIADLDSGGITSVEFVLRNLDGITPDFVIGKGSFVAATGKYKFTGSITKPASSNVIWIKITDKNKGVSFESTGASLNIV